MDDSLENEVDSLDIHESDVDEVANEVVDDADEIALDSEAPIVHDDVDIIHVYSSILFLFLLFFHFPILFSNSLDQFFPILLDLLHRCIAEVEDQNSNFESYFEDYSQEHPSSIQIKTLNCFLL